jgi:outer membrane lipoprotein SlyB
MLGEDDGSSVGADVGRVVGWRVGSCVGSEVGKYVEAATGCVSGRDTEKIANTTKIPASRRFDMLAN